MSSKKEMTVEEAKEAALKIMREHDIRVLRNHTRLKLETKIKEAGLSPTQFATQLGVSYPAVRGWLNGDTAPRGLSRTVLENYFSEPVETLLAPDEG